MSILGFKDWYKNKEKNESISRSGKYSTGEKISESIFRINPKVLTLQLDNSGLNQSKGSDRVERYLIDDSIIDEARIKEISNFIGSICETKKIYLVGYDTTTENIPRAFKNSKKIVESLGKKIQSSRISTRAMGNIEQINYSIPKPKKDFSRTRIEIWVMDQEPQVLEKEIPFLFNANDYNLIQKYQTPLKGLLYKLILSENKKEIKIGCMKPWTTSRGKLNESQVIEENNRVISALKYTIPNKLSHTDPENKPKVSGEKITNLELTYKRADSISSFLNKYSLNYGFSFKPDGLGVKEGDSRIIIDY